MVYSTIEPEAAGFVETRERSDRLKQGREAAPETKGAKRPTE